MELNARDEKKLFFLFEDRFAGMIFLTSRIEIRM